MLPHRVAARASGRSCGSWGAALGLAASLWTATGCNNEELASRWVPHDAAMVRCTTAGRDRMPPVLLDLPVPAVPTGLLVRQLDPMALNDMGYEREQPVCAALLRPSEETIDQARAGVQALLARYRETGPALRGALGRCGCEAARAADLADLVASCRDEPFRSGCVPTPEAIEKVQQVVQPLREALAATAVPRLHWRAAGRSDRPGWIVERLTELLPRHAGGATVFLQGQAIPSRHNHVLVRRLFDEPGVSAVLRLDGGRSLLVIRELDDALVLDLLSFPRVDARLVALLPYIDEARAEAVVGSLSRPASAWSSPLPFDQGNLVHLDRQGLRAVDTMLLAAAPLGGLEDAPTRLPSPETPPLVDAITLQARFGTEGKVLRGRLALGAEGQSWAQTLGKERLGPQLELLGLPLGRPLPPPVLDLPLGFVVHGTSTEAIVLGGLEHTASFLRVLEMQHPGAVEGTVEAWKWSMPPGAIAPGGTVPPAEALRSWAERVAAERHEVSASFDGPRRVLTVELAPG